MNVAIELAGTDDRIYPACLNYAARHTPEGIRETSQGAEADQKKIGLREHDK